MKDDYILIVDDELPIREMIHTSLDMAGFQCLQAEDAKQAHQMIVDQRPALILLDWMMPGGVSGVDLCRRLKRDDNLAEIPVIMLTARGEEDQIRDDGDIWTGEECVSSEGSAEGSRSN